MVEQVEAEVAAEADEGICGDPAGEPPQQVVAGDQAEQDHDAAPEHGLAGRAMAQHVDQGLDRVLRGDGAADGAQHRQQHDEVAPGPPQDIMQQEPRRAARGVARQPVPPASVPPARSPRAPACSLTSTTVLAPRPTLTS